MYIGLILSAGSQKNSHPKVILETRAILVVPLNHLFELFEPLMFVTRVVSPGLLTRLVNPDQTALIVPQPVWNASTILETEEKGLGVRG